MQDIISNETEIQRRRELSQQMQRSWIQDRKIKTAFYIFTRDCTSPLSECQRPSHHEIVTATCAIIRTHGLNSCTAAQLKFDAGGQEAENYVWFAYQVVFLMSGARSGECWDMFYGDLEVWCSVALKFLEEFRHQKQIGNLPSEEAYRRKVAVNVDYSIYRGSYESE